MRRLFPLLSLSLLLFLAPKMLLAQDNSGATVVDVTVEVIIDNDGLTLYVPGNQVVSLADVGFEVTIDGRVTVTYIDSYPALGIDLEQLQPPLCLRLVRSNGNAPPPSGCWTVSMATQSLTDADVFWHDRATGRRSVTILQGNNRRGQCLAGEAQCTVKFPVSVAATPIVEQPPTMPPTITLPTATLTPPPTSTPIPATATPTITPLPPTATPTAQEWFNIGEAERTVGNNQLALNPYAQAIALDPNFAAAYNSRGGVYEQLGNYDQALADYTAAINIDPRLEFYANRGNVYLRLMRNGLAISDFTFILVSDPNYAYAYWGRGLAHYHLGEYEQALADYEQYQRLNGFVEEFMVGQMAEMRAALGQ